MPTKRCVHRQSRNGWPVRSAARGTHNRSWRRELTVRARPCHFFSGAVPPVVWSGPSRSSRRESSRRITRRNIGAESRPQRSVLDVGCGLGFFLRALDPKRWDRYGIEPMPFPYREAAHSLGADRVLNTELIAAGLPSGKFDVVTFWDSLEHLPNPRAVLQEVGRLLRPGGIILIGLPNFGGYQAHHFGDDWFGLSLPHHLCHYTRETLTRLLDGCGFSVRVMEDRSGPENYHALKHSLLKRLTRLHGPRGGRLRYYSVKPFLHPWEWISTRWGGGSSLQVCAERVSAEAAGFFN
ncbi:MAG: hypothetical protein DMG30_11065 [Acidobacteria bacterium]|nr:MAG: hypothetical protein DMG30_11065 [Acidobacteriota bacterium]